MSIIVVIIVFIGLTSLVLSKMFAFVVIVIIVMMPVMTPYGNLTTIPAGQGETL